MDTLDQLRYPVGRLPRDNSPLPANEREAILTIFESTPGTIRSLVSGLADAQLDTPYRPGGWTIRQVVHHLPDSHINAYVRMKLAATEDAPVIRTYEEQLWAELPEAKSAPIAMSLDLLDGLHRRWVAFLRGLDEAEFRKAFVHPEWGPVTLDGALRMYGWHCRHHTAHINLGIAAGA
ncbi:MAG: YfiT family bacillithiol transferase [Acidobacteriota bacterium]